MQGTINQIQQWGIDKDILNNVGIYTFQKKMAQISETLEEVSELNTALINDNKAEIDDAIGDILVTLILQAKMNGLYIDSCLNKAYGVISKRSGKIVNGVFVKNEDNK